MGTIADKLYKLSAIKNSIRSALARKGKIADELFSSYSGLIDQIHPIDLSSPVGSSSAIALNLSGSYGTATGYAYPSSIASVTHNDAYDRYEVTFNNNVPVTIRMSNGAMITIRLSGKLLLNSL